MCETVVLLYCTILQFFSVNYANRGDLFEKQFIWKEEKYRNLQGTYPVLSISFANVKETNYELTKKRIFQILENLYAKYQFLLESDILTSGERIYFKSISAQMDEVDASDAIHNLCKYLYRYYGKKVIVLLDEYDTPMQEAYVDGYWKELTAFTRSLFNTTFKTNPWLERGIMTGITRVSKESIFSDLNNLKVVTTTSNEYADCFGFTEKEVFCSMLALTNWEVKLMFGNMVAQWFENAEADYNDFIKALLLCFNWISWNRFWFRTTGSKMGWWFLHAKVI